MRSILAIAALAVLLASGHPSATAVDMPLAPTAPAFSAVAAAGQHLATEWNGKWQGTAVSGQPLVLEVKMEGERMTGRLTVGKQSAKIIAGKVVGDNFAITTDPIDGNKVEGTGRRTGDSIELQIEGVKDHLTLTRVK
jgi:hypothetical protein